MPDVYKMAIQSIAEVFAVVAIFIGFANEEKIKAWEHRQWLKIAHRLHGLINRKTLNKPAPKKGRKRANIGDYDCYEDAYSRSANWEPKYKTKRHKRSEEFIDECKTLAEQKRQRRRERNLKLSKIK